MDQKTFRAFRNERNEWGIARQVQNPETFSGIEEVNNRDRATRSAWTHCRPDQGAPGTRCTMSTTLSGCGGLLGAEAQGRGGRGRRDGHYGETLESNLRDLSGRLKRGADRAKPVRRVYISKEDGGERPLGVPTLEDKIVQRAVVEWWAPSTRWTSWDFRTDFDRGVARTKRWTRWGGFTGTMGLSDFPPLCIIGVRPWTSRQCRTSVRHPQRTLPITTSWVWRG